MQVVVPTWSTTSTSFIPKKEDQPKRIQSVRANGSRLQEESICKRVAERKINYFCQSTMEVPEAALQTNNQLSPISRPYGSTSRYAPEFWTWLVKQ